MRTGLARSRIAPWAGWVLGPAAWAVDHQTASNWSFATQHCAAIGPPIVALGVVCALVSAAAALVSWAGRPLGARESEDNLRAFIAWMGTMGGALFMLAILYGTFASLVIPPCET